MILAFGEKSLLLPLESAYPGSSLIGEMIERGKLGNPARKLIWPKAAAWLDQWTRERQSLLSSSEKSQSPNIIFLDAEERRWVKPRRGLGEVRADNSEIRWMPSYRATENWEGQLEASLLALKSAALHRFHEVIREMNGFLSGKEILTDVELGVNRLQVKIKKGQKHGLDELSAGEHQVLIQLYLIARWMEEGGIVMIDEPDLYLHPSLLPGFLAQLEKMVADRKGQLFLTSHIPEIWSRYENLGRRILLEAKP